MAYSSSKGKVLAVLFERDGARLDIRVYAGGVPRATYTRPVGGGEVRHDAFPREAILTLLDSASEVRRFLGADPVPGCVEYDEGDDMEGVSSPLVDVNVVQSDAEA